MEKIFFFVFVSFDDMSYGVSFKLCAQILYSIMIIPPSMFSFLFILICCTEQNAFRCSRHFSRAMASLFTDCGIVYLTFIIFMWSFCSRGSVFSFAFAGWQSVGVNA